jgi:osmotically inducible lipoprotein OsmB
MTGRLTIRNPILQRSIKLSVDERARDRLGTSTVGRRSSRRDTLNRSYVMRKTLSVLAIAGIALTLAACGHNVEQRASTGAITGAVIGGPVGAAAGAAVGTMVSKSVDK